MAAVECECLSGWYGMDKELLYREYLRWLLLRGGLLWLLWNDLIGVAVAEILLLVE